MGLIRGSQEKGGRLSGQAREKQGEKMTNNYTRMATPLSKAKNLGAGGGAHHWWMQRLTAIIMIPLIFWLVYFIYAISGHSVEEVMQRLQKPYNIIPAMLFLLTGLYHGVLGMQVVIEDYVSCLQSRYFLIISLKILTLVTALGGVMALLSLMH